MTDPEGMSEGLRAMRMPDPPVRAPEGWITLSDALERIPPGYSGAVRAIKQTVADVIERLTSKIAVSEAEGGSKIDFSVERSMMIEAFMEISALIWHAEGHKEDARGVCACGKDHT